MSTLFLKKSIIMYYGTIGGNDLIEQYENDRGGMYTDSKRDRREFLHGEMAAENADERTRNLYNDLYSPQAQIQQLKEAGMSPSIFASGGLAGKSGVSGAQGTGGGGNTGGTQAVGQIFSAIQGGLNSAMQMAQLKSQIDLNNAQAKKLNNEADTITGNNERGKAEISQILADAGLKQAQTNYTNSQNTYQTLQNYIKDSTAEYEIEIVKSEAQTFQNQAFKTYYEWQREKQNFEFEQTTFEERVKQVNLETQQLEQQILNSKQGRELTEAQTTSAKQATEKMQYEMQMLYSNYELSAKEVALKAQEIKQNYYVELQKLNILDYQSKHGVTNQYLNNAFRGLAEFTNAAYMDSATKAIIRKIK